MERSLRWDQSEAPIANPSFLPINLSSPSNATPCKKGTSNFIYDPGLSCCEIAEIFLFNIPIATRLTLNLLQNIASEHHRPRWANTTSQHSACARVRSNRKLQGLMVNFLRGLTLFAISPPLKSSCAIDPNSINLYGNA